MDATKYCPCCQATKPVDQFNVDTKRKGGRAGHCKLCRRARDVRDRLKRMEDGTLGDYLEKRRVIESKSVSKNRDRVKVSQVEYHKNNTIKMRAHTMINNRVKVGKIKRQPCEICGNEKSQAHHDDYAQPLAIRWLCCVHHKDWHVRNGPGLNGTLSQEKAA